MNDLEFGEAITSFTTVHDLRELLKNYDGDTLVAVCGAPGLFYPDEEKQCIFLEPSEAYMESKLYTTMEQEYMDF